MLNNEQISCYRQNGFVKAEQLFNKKEADYFPALVATRILGGGGAGRSGGGREIRREK